MNSTMSRPTRWTSSWTNRTSKPCWPNSISSLERAEPASQRNAAEFSLAAACLTHCQNGPQSRFPVRQHKFVSETLELFRQYPLASEQQPIGHFSQRQAQSEGRSREDRGTPQDSRQHFREVRVAYRVWRDGVGRPSQRIRRERKLNHRYQLFERQPGHPLPPRAQPAACAKTERESHPRQGASVFVEDDAGSQDHGSRPKFRGSQRCRFPLASQVSQEIPAGRARFGELFVPAIAVETDGRSPNEHTRRPIQFLQRIDQAVRRRDAAVGKHMLARSSPAAFGNGGAREVHHGVCAVGALFKRSGPRIPAYGWVFVLDLGV